MSSLSKGHHQVNVYQILQFLIIQYTLCKSDSTHEHIIMKTRTMITMLMIMKLITINDDDNCNNNDGNNNCHYIVDEILVGYHHSRDQ